MERWSRSYDFTVVREYERKKKVSSLKPEFSKKKGKGSQSTIVSIRPMEIRGEQGRLTPRELDKE